MGDPVYDFLNSGGKTAPAAPATSPSGKPSNDPVYDFLNSGGKALPPMQEKTPMDAPIIKAGAQYTPDNTTALEVGGHVLSGLAANIAGGWHGLAKLASGGSMDEAANAVRDDVEKFTYEPTGAEAKDVVGKINSNANPLVLAGKGAKKLGEMSQDYLGASPGVATAIETGANVLLPGAALKAAKIPLRVVKPEGSVGAPAISERVEPTLSAPEADTLSAFRSARERVKAATIWETAQRDLTEALKNPETPQTTIDSLQAKAATAEAASKKLDLAPTEPPARTAETEPTHFLDAAPEAGPTGSVEATQRAKILQRVGIDQARLSALEGDAKAAATDFQSSKLDNAAGKHMFSVLEGEKQALHDYSESIVRDTGGTIDPKGAELYSRGNTIIAPLDALKEFFDRGISGLYKEADARAKGVPTKLDTFSQVLGDDSLMTNSDRVHLRDSMNAYLKKLGIADTQEITVAQAETIRKRLNENWSPQNSKYTSALKEALDDDVMKAAGDDVYQSARALRAKRARVLDDPKGIAKLMDASGPDGINRSVPVEKIADTLAGLPADQLAHVIKTLKDVPPELKPQAEAALSEIKAHFANKVLEAGSKHQGQWAARDVSKYLNNNAARLKQIFTPEELDKFNDLNDAGHILAKDQSYPGAAVQEHNLVQRGVMAGVKAGAAATGGALFGGPGAAVGGFLGEKAAKAFGEGAALKSSQKRVVKLSDFPGVND